MINDDDGGDDDDDDDDDDSGGRGGGGASSYSIAQWQINIIEDSRFCICLQMFTVWLMTVYINMADNDYCDLCAFD